LCKCVIYEDDVSATTETNARRLEIKKYPNRRYYDTTHSRHLTLDEIHSLIRKGYDLSATDAKTGEDITAQLLTQIILELETGKLDSFPVPLLLRVIRTNDQLMKDFIEQYFNQALQSFMDYQRRWEDQVRRAQGLTPSIPTVSAWMEAMFKPFTAAFGTSAAGQAPQPGPQDSKAAADGDLRQLIQELQQQVMELKDSQSEKGRKTRVRRSKKSSSR